MFRSSHFSYASKAHPIMTIRKRIKDAASLLTKPKRVASLKASAKRWADQILSRAAQAFKNKMKAKRVKSGIPFKFTFAKTKNAKWMSNYRK